MNCGKMMTSNPACCTPSDTVAKAAHLMKSEDVGSIPVVSDSHDKKLIGIVTDRDLAVKVVAAGRDPQTTLVESVMTSNPISCREEQDVEQALRAMSEHQVRRIPIVDAYHRLSGIISQADVARKMHEETVGSVVEDISQRRGMLSWSGSYEPSRPRSAAKNAAMAMGLGAGIMYLLDPNRGSERRAYIRDHATNISQKTRNFVSSASHEVRHRTEGAVSGAKSLLGRSGEMGEHGNGNMLRGSAMQMTTAGLGGGLALYGLLRKSRLARTAAAAAGVALVARSLANRQRSTV